jgi:hypothetical protein
MRVYHGSYTKIIEIDLSKCEIGKETATDKFFSSDTFAKLADENTEFYKKPWQEIYEFLKQEMNITYKLKIEKKI